MADYRVKKNKVVLSVPSNLSKKKNKNRIIISANASEMAKTN